MAGSRDTAGHPRRDPLHLVALEQGTQTLPRRRTLTDSHQESANGLHAPPVTPLRRPGEGYAPWLPRLPARNRDLETPGSERRAGAEATGAVQPDAHRNRQPSGVRRTRLVPERADRRGPERHADARRCRAVLDRARRRFY